MDEVSSNAMAKAMLESTKLCMGALSPYLNELEDKGKIKDKQKLIYHLQDYIGYFVRQHWVDYTK